jgi:2-hydroxy-6-oxonona-2,4-dienedioate hydrolase
MSAMVEKVASTQAVPVEIARLEAMTQRFDIAYLGRTVRWRRWGEGPALVLVHGGHGSWMHWVRNIELLTRQRTVWVPDLPGFGDSDDLAGDAHARKNKQHLLDAVSATLDTLVGREAPIDVAGFSFGGLVAAELSAQRGNVRRLALLGSAGHGGTRRQRTELVNWRSDDLAQMRVALRHNLAALMLHEPASIDDLALFVHEASCLRTRFRSKSISRAGGLHGDLDRYGGEALLIWGEHDVTAVPHDIAPRLAGDDTRREWCVVPGAGHWVQYEQPDDVNRLLANWLAADPGVSR